ncbi:MAG: insulinase family protein, partial [Bacteroidota bacterium]
MKQSYLFLLLISVFVMGTGATCNKEVAKTMEQPAPTETEMVSVGSTPLPKYDYRTVPGDPLGTKIYTLSNGMKVFMSVNKDEPRIQTNIAVRAGSKHDPADATGLAHYLEHMLFKGTSKVGALDWDKEKVLLQEISDLYEAHRGEKDTDQRKMIYGQIDSLSNEASKLVAANEYDKMVSSLGAKGTNAYTWVEQTVYINDIPANELERWMKLESERFQECVLRLFHTELEAVYEEFNINQDRDFRKVSKAIYETLFPSHPYGLQTTIGKGEHLKNPSHVKIQEYFKKYYAPNNMAIVLSGDFNPDDAAAMAEKYFGAYEKRTLEPFTFPEQPELDQIVRKEVYGQESEYVEMAWRFEGINSDDPLKLMMLRGLLYNGQAGLMDINLAQKQQVLEPYASARMHEDFSMFSIDAKPREGQDLEEVEKLLISQINQIKRGEFDEWLMDAVIKDMKLGEIRSNESNRARAGIMTNSFIWGLDWADYVNRFQEMKALTKAEMVAFANEHLKDNYVVVYKRTGDDKGAYKVEKPAITPVSLNRENSSDYTKEFMKTEAPRMSPEFIDYQKGIQKHQLASGLGMDYIENKSNETFSLYYILEMGKESDKKLPLAVNYLPYLGTSKYSAEELQKEFFKLGLSFDVFSGNDRVYAYLSGLEESFEEGVKLFEHILANVEGNEQVLKNQIADILTARENAKKDKRTILRSGMVNFARHGKDSPFTDILSKQELEAIQPAELVQKIKSLTSFDHRVFYYGSKTPDQVKQVLDQYHQVPSTRQTVLPAKSYPELATLTNKVYFVDFPMVQAEIMLLSKGTPNFSLEEYLVSELYNSYFGFGLSSIVFQEIRESKALAYSAYAYYGSPSKKDRAHYFQAYVGTQVDKLKDAIPAMQEIIENMPVAEAQIENSKQSILKKIESERINKTRVYWTSKTNQNRGFDRDLRQDVYQKIKRIGVEELKSFHQQYVKGRNYSFLVLGSKESVDMDYLKSIGPV